MAQAGLVAVLVDGQSMGAQDKVNGLPGLEAWGLVGVGRSGEIVACAPRKVRTLVFRVRFSSSPDLRTRSNSKLPFWLTGEKTPRPRSPFSVASSGGGGVEVLILMRAGLEGMDCGAAAGATSAIVVAEELSQYMEREWREWWCGIVVRGYGGMGALRCHGA